MLLPYDRVAQSVEHMTFNHGVPDSSSGTVTKTYPTRSGWIMKQQEYLDLKKRHEKELSDFPIAYAFNDKQLEEALEKLGATKEECVTIFGHGDIVKRENAKPFIKMLE